MAVLHFIETTKFSKQVKEQMSDDEYRLFQENLITYPEQGDLIVGTGGVRKTRWAINDKGKSGGVRVIYFFVDEKGIFYMLLAYAKSQKVTLSAIEKRELLKFTKLIKQVHQDEK